MEAGETAESDGINSCAPDFDERNSFFNRRFPSMLVWVKAKVGKLVRRTIDVKPSVRAAAPVHDLTECRLLWVSLVQRNGASRRDCV